MKKAIQLHLILVLLLVTVERANACSCLSKSEKNWLTITKSQLGTYSDIILGEVVSSDNDIYSIVVLDTFRGNAEVYDTVTIEVNKYCWVEFEPGLGVFYGELNKEGIIEVSECSISRNLSFLSGAYPSLELESAIGKPVDLEKEELKRQSLLLKNWILEYALLNAYRNSHPKQPQPQTPNKDYLSYLAVALSIIAVLAVFVRKQR